MSINPDSASSNSPCRGKSTQGSAVNHASNEKPADLAVREDTRQLDVLEHHARTESIRLAHIAPSFIIGSRSVRCHTDLLVHAHLELGDTLPDP